MTMKYVCDEDCESDRCPAKNPAPPEVPAPDEVSETYPELDEVWIYIRDDGSLADALPAMKPSKPHHAAPPGAWVRYVRAREGGR